MISHKWHEHDMPCTHVPPADPTLHNSYFYTSVWGYFEDVKLLWCGFREGVQPANCIHGSCERAVNDNRHWTEIEGLRGVSNSVGMIGCVLCAPALSNTPSFHKNPRKESSLCFYEAGLACRFSSAPGVEVLAVVSSIIPPSVIRALSCPIDLCLDLKDLATKCISRIFIAWTSTTITIKNPGDHQTCTWNLLWLSSASFGPKHRFGQFSGPVNHVSSRNRLALYRALVQDQPLWPWVVFPQRGLCQ